MVRQVVFVGAALLGGLLASAVRAGQLPAASIPAEARWVMHLNVDAARGTALWDLLRQKIVEPRRAEIAAKVVALENITGVRLPRDLHDVTLFGTNFEEGSLGLLIHAPIDEERVTSILKKDVEFRSSDHNGHTIMTWRDKERDRLMYGSFMPGDVVVLSPSLKTLALALDTMDGKSPPTKNARLLPPGATTEGTTRPAADEAGPILWIASTHVSDLPGHQAMDSPFLVQADTASMGIGMMGDRMWAKATVLANSEKAAQQLSAATDGLKAMISLSASDEHANVRVRLLAEALQSLAIAAEGRELKADWSIDISKLNTILQVVRPAVPPAAATSAAPPLPPAAPPTPPAPVGAPGAK